MKPRQKKWVLLALGLGLAGVMTFLFRATSRQDAPAAPAGSRMAPAARPAPETPEHELQALAVHLQKKPGHVPVLMRMAQLERERGKTAEAEARLREALKTEPSNLDARLELGRVLYERGDIAGAIGETQKILASAPGQIDALYNLGAIYANLGNRELARSYWTKASQADPGAESGRKAREGLARLGGT